MNRLGLTDYNSAIKGIYDSNTITPDGEEEKIPSGTKQSKSGESTLVKESLRLRNTAVLNLKLKQRIFKYEKKRLNKLKVEDVLGSGKVTSGGARGITGVVPGAEGDEGGGFGFGLPRLFFGNRLRGKGRFKGRSKVTVGKGGTKSNIFKKLNPFKRRITSTNRVPGGLNNPLKGLGNPFKNLFKPKVTSKIPGGLNNPLKGLGNPFKKRPPITRGKGGIPPGLNKLFPNLFSKVTTGKGNQPGIIKNLGRLNPLKTKITGIKPGMLGGLKNVRSIPLLSAIFAGFEFAGRKGEGQTNVQAGLGTAGSTAGGLAGLKGGAALGATIGTAIFPGAGTVVGGILGGLVGGFAGSSIGGGLTDMITGANRNKKAKSINTYEKEETPNKSFSVKRDVTGRFDLDTGKAYINGQEVSHEEYTKFINLSKQEKIQQYGQIPELKDGGVTGNTPQIVIVGDGGEKEYIVPESKLSYFLGTSQAARYLNYGVSPLITAAKKYARSEGIDTSSIKELKELSNIPGDQNVKPIIGLENNLGQTFFDIIKKGLMKLLKPFSIAVGVISALNPINLFSQPAKAGTRIQDRPTIEKIFGTDTYATGLRTAPKGYMGSGTEYHIDTKFNKSLSMEDRVNMVDQMAASYAERGRKIEFSNSAVAGRTWDMNAPMEVKIKLLQAAQAAHSHSLHSNYDSIDYYIPNMNMDRWHKSAENAEIIVPTVEGGKVNYGQGGGYGAFVTVTDAEGNILVKTGHGDIRDAKTGSVDVPVKPTINKDNIVEQDPMEDIEISLPQIVLPQAQVVTQYVPLPVPVHQMAKGTSSSNTPAWGNNSVIGG